MSEQHHLAAILFTDIVSYTAMMQHDEELARVVIKRHNAVLEKTVAAHHGEVVNYYGDGSLCIFSSATESVRCAIDIQKELQTEPVVPLRIGLHIGEIFFEDGKALGDAVNIASRIQSLGQANTILFSKEIFDKIRNHPEFKAVSLGHFDFKNVDESVEVFVLANEGLVVPKREKMEGKLKELKKKNVVRKNIFIIVSALILLIVAGFLYSKYFKQESNEIDKSIAVLPFINMSNDKQQEYFAEGMMDEILNHLYKIGDLNVISRTSSMAYKDSKKTSKEIAKELGASNLLEGSVQKEGDRIRIIVQLIDAKNDKHLWAETYDREFKDVFVIQSDISQEIAAALKLKIDPTVKERIEKKPTGSTEAYNLYLQAIDPYISLEKSKTLLEAAITLDSSFADAYAALARTWIFGGGYGGEHNAEEVLQNARPLLQKALKLDPNLAETHLALGDMFMLYQWDLVSAGSEYQKALQLNPSNAEITVEISDFLLATGKFKEALEISSNASIKDSSSYFHQGTLALAYAFNNNFGEALQKIKKAFSLAPKIDWVWTNFIRINTYAGEYKNAIDVFEKNKTFFEPLSSYALAHAAIAYYKTGQKDSTQKFLNEIKLRSEKSPAGSPSYFIAAIYTAMGENDEAIKWLQKAYADHEVEMYWLKVEPLFKPLHGDPRFQELLNKIGFK